MICSVAKSYELPVEDDLTSPGARLRWARERAGYATAADAARALRIQPVTYRAYEADQNSPVKIAARASRLFGVSTDWLIEGGSFPEGRPPVAGEAGSPQVLADRYNIALIRQVDISYAMGDGALIEDYPETGFIPFNLDFLAQIGSKASDRLFVARGEGDSMSPTIYDSDIVLIDAGVNRVTMQDRIWALVVGGAGMIKRIRMLPGGEVLVLSDNQNVPPQSYSADDVHIVGRVMWIGRRV